MPGTVVRLKALDGTWETCGVDRVARVVPESVDVDSDDWGNKTAKFDLKRDPGLVWPDIGAYAPVVVEIDGQPSWAGRVIETPSRGRVMTVNCEGWQHHLDDDMLERKYVHASLGDWKDVRSALTADLSVFTVGPTVDASGGVVRLAVPPGATWPNYGRVGVVMDMGQGGAAKTLAVDYIGGGRAGVSLDVWAFDGNVGQVASIAQGVTIDAAPIATVASMTGLVCTVPHRFIVILMTNVSGATMTGDDTTWVRITGARLYAEAAYESSGQSVLKASAVVADAVNKATVLLAADRSGIVDTSFSIPEFAPSGPQTPRELISAVNGWHNWIRKVDVNKRPIFAPLPSRPKYTAALGVELEDSSQNSGRDIYNRVLVTGTDALGQPVRVYRVAGQGDPTAFSMQGAPTFSNPSFDTNAAGWSTNGGGSNPIRTTTGGEYDTAPAGMKLQVSGLTIKLYASTVLNGTFYAGTAYRLKFWYQNLVNGSFRDVFLGSQLIWTDPLGSIGGSGYVTAVFVPNATVVNPTLTLQGWDALVTNPHARFDSFTMEVANRSLPSRRGFLRTKQLQVGVTLPSDGAAAAAIGDLWLQANSLTPFRGTVTLTGPKALRDRVSGQPVPLKQLLADTGELIHFPNRPDPDFGAVGRNGRIASVSYNPATDTATVAIDSNRGDFEALMSRMAVTQVAG